MVIIDSLIDYAIEIIKLAFIQYGIIGYKCKKGKRVYLTIAVSAVLLAVMALLLPSEILTFVSGCIAIVTIGLASEGGKKKYLSSFINYVYVCILDMILYGIVTSVFELNHAVITGNKALYIVFNLLSLIILIPSALHNKEERQSLKEGYFKNNILLYVGGVALLFFLTLLLFSSQETIDSEYRKYAKILICVISAIFIVCTKFVISYRVKIEMLEKEKVLTKELVKSQEKYYTMLLEREKETQEFRHDIRNHLYCMWTLYDEKNYQEFEKYYQNIVDGLTKIKRVYNVGNNLVDAIVNDMASEFPKVKFAWKGMLPDKFAIPSIDVCTIFFNLICNSFEAADSTSEHIVNGTVKFVGTTMMLNLENSSANKPKISNGKFISSKTERCHGYGIGNVMRTVEKYNGSLKMYWREGSVNVELILPGAYEGDDRPLAVN